MESKTYTMELSRPIEAHGETVSTLTLKDPDSGALEGIELTIGPHGLRIDLGAFPKVISSAAGIPLSSARKILARDLFEHTEGLLDFLGLEFRSTGES